MTDHTDMLLPHHSLHDLAYALYQRVDGDKHPYLIGPLHRFLTTEKIDDEAQPEDSGQ